MLWHTRDCEPMPDELTEVTDRTWFLRRDHAVETSIDSIHLASGNYGESLDMTLPAAAIRFRKPRLDRRPLATIRAAEPGPENHRDGHVKSITSKQPLRETMPGTPPMGDRRSQAERAECVSRNAPLDETQAHRTGEDPESQIAQTSIRHDQRENQNATRGGDENPVDHQDPGSEFEAGD